MWFVLEVATETTIAMCRFEDVARYIAETFPMPCIMRYTEDMNAGCSQHNTFFDKLAKTA